MAVDSGVSPNQMDFWDGMESVFMMPSITPTERKIIWDAVAGYAQKQLLLHKGIRIPTLGSFDVVHTETLVGNKTVILQRPMFHLARNLGGVQNLENKDDMAGGKQLEPLKYAKVAMEASVSRRKVRCCILGTTSLLHHCLEKGVSVAFALRDVGVLLIEGSMVQMRFYLDFLEKVTGERIQDRATLKALQQLDIVVSRAVPITSRSFTGRVIIFPNFEQAFLPASLPSDYLKDFGFVPQEDKRNKIGLPPIRRGMEGRLPGLPVPAHQASTATAGEQPRDEEAMEIRHSSRVRKLPAIPGAAAGRKQPVTDQAKGKPIPKGQASKQSDKEVASAQRSRGGRGEREDSLGREGENKAHLGRDEEKEVQLGKKGERREFLGREGENKARLGRDEEKEVQLRKEGERRESLGREGEKVHLGSEGERRDSLREGERKDSFSREEERRGSLGREGERKDLLRREGERRDYLKKEEERRDSFRREGEKKVLRGREKEAKDAVGSEEEKEVCPKRGDNKVSPKRKGEKKVPLGRGKNKVPIGREGEKKFHLKREEVKYLLGREREKRFFPGREGEREAPLGSTLLPWSARARKPQNSKVFILQQPGPEAVHRLRARPEAFWSVLKEPQKSILAGYRSESSHLLPPLPPQGAVALQLPMLKKREMVSRGPWPWVE